MNFAYGVEHYFHAFDHDVKTANKKFSKYAARMFEVIPNIPDEGMKTCLTTAFQNINKPMFSTYIIGLTQVKDMADNKLIPLLNSSDSSVVFNFVTAIYMKCVPLSFELFYDVNDLVTKLYPSQQEDKLDKEKARYLTKGNLK